MAEIKFKFERIEEAEIEFGVSIDNLSAEIKSWGSKGKTVEIFYELNLREGKKLKRNLHVNFIFYSKSGRIVRNESDFFWEDNFYLTGAGRCYFECSRTPEYSKIRVFPSGH